MSQHDDFEHVTKYYYEHPSEFRIKNFRNNRDLSKYRLVVDTPEDLNRIENIIGSMSKPYTEYNFDELLKLYPVTKNKPWPYSTQKCALDHACEQLQNSKGKCRVINIKPGFVDTPRVASFDAEHKMDPDYIAKVILWCIEQPEYLMTLRINPWNY